MSAIHWTSGVKGNWNDPRKWSTGAAPTAADDVTVAAAGAYTITVNSADVAGSLTFNSAKAILSESASGTLSIGGAANLVAGTIALHGANSFGTFDQSGGVLQLFNAGALGSAGLTIIGGELTGGATETISNSLALGGSAFTIDAMTGQVVDFGGGGWALDTSGAPTLRFGSASRAGTVVWHTPSSDIFGGGAYGVTVAGGTLRAADSGFSDLFATAGLVKIATGAAVELAGFDLAAQNLTGGGTITNSMSPMSTMVTLGAGAFAGTISGAVAVNVTAGSLTLSGADTYSGGTTVGDGTSFQLGDGKTTGSIVGPVIDNGAFTIDDAGAVTLSGVISGTGVVIQSGSGATTLAGHNTFEGGAVLNQGTLVVTNASALSTGPLTLNGGELLASNSFTLADTQFNNSHSIQVSGDVILAAAHGKTLTIGDSLLFDNGGSLTFGSAGEDGVVIVTTAFAANLPAININAGTLQVGGDGLSGLFEFASGLAIASGGVFELGGFNEEVLALTGAGVVANSTGAATIFASLSGTFAGSIIGDVTFACGNVTLTGSNSYVDGTEILATYTLTLGDGGASGSIIGAIDDEGALAVNESGAAGLAGAISGAGSFAQTGAGTTTLSGVNSYGGGTTIARGALVSANGLALGVGGVISLSGGELLASSSQTLTHDLATSGAATLAAGHADVLTLASGNDAIGAGKLVFGQGANNGTVIFRASGAVSVGDGAHTAVEVRAGVLAAGDRGLSSLLSQVGGVQIDAGASLDAAGRALTVNGLTGSGALTNSGAAAVLTLTGAANFSGAIGGAFSTVKVMAAATLSGTETFAGTAEIDAGALTVAGTFAEAVKFNGGTLALAAPAVFTGTIQNFTAGDTIDLATITAGAAAVISYDTKTKTLTVSDGTHTDHLTFSGAYKTGNFVAAADGSGGTSIGWQTAPMRQTFVQAMAGLGAAHCTSAEGAFSPSPAGAPILLASRV